MSFLVDNIEVIVSGRKCAKLYACFPLCGIALLGVWSSGYAGGDIITHNRGYLYERACGSVVTVEVYGAAVYYGQRHTAEIGVSAAARADVFVVCLDS